MKRERRSGEVSARISTRKAEKQRRKREKPWEISDKGRDKRIRETTTATTTLSPVTNDVFVIAAVAIAGDDDVAGDLLFIRGDCFFGGLVIFIGPPPNEDLYAFGPTKHGLARTLRLRQFSREKVNFDRLVRFGSV